MAAKTVGAFAAGVVVGWIGRSVLGSTREAVVQVLVLSQRVRDGLKRVVAEQVEWLEDTFAEGRARHEASRVDVPMQTEVPPQVVEVKKKRGQAA